jgi:6-phosphogluconate dehydrogenase, C-terminal domain
VCVCLRVRKCVLPCDARVFAVLLAPECTDEHESLSGALASCRRARLPANLVQAQRDFFGSHTYQRIDTGEPWFHTVWSDANSADSITTSGYNN